MLQETRDKISTSMRKHLETDTGKAQLMRRTQRNLGSVRTAAATTATSKKRRADTAARFLMGQVTERKVLRRPIAERDGYKCSECPTGDMWNGKPITLQVDHRDGNPGNNMPANLRLICPNCHSQTPSWGARNKGSGRKARGITLA